MAKEKIITIGGAGYVGSIFTQKYSSEFDITDLSFESGFDISNLDQVKQEINRHRPNRVVNFAALTNTKAPESERANFDAVNHIGVANLVKVCSHQNIPLVHVSTDMVYSGNDPKVLTEEDIPDATDVYGGTKRLGEQEASKYSNALIVRLAYPTSESTPPRPDLIRKIILSLQTKGQAFLFNDQLIMPTVTEEFVDALYKLMISDRTGIYNCSGPEAYTPYQLGILVAHELGFTKDQIQKIIVPTSVVEVNRTNEYKFPVSIKLSTDKLNQAGVYIRDISSIIPLVVRQTSGDILSQIKSNTSKILTPVTV